MGQRNVWQWNGGKAVTFIPLPNTPLPQVPVTRNTFRIPLLRLGLGAFIAPLRFAFALLLLIGGPVHAQETGSVAGVVVSSWDGALLAGATVTVRGTTLAAQTDSSGKFQLNGVPVGEQVLRFSKSSYAAAVVTDVRVLPGQTTTVNGNLRPEFYEMEEYEVTAEEFTQQTEQIIFERQQSGAMVDGVGSEMFSKFGSSDAADIMSKVSGTTVVDGKYAVIRGLTDRYSAATLNGAELPSADPYRRSASLDMFPAKIIDRVTVAKTFTPDQPGSFTGGNINIVTKTAPDKAFATFEMGASYNTQASLNEDFLTYPGGGTDWLGMDDGTRALASELAAADLVIPSRFTIVNLNNASQAAIRLAAIAELDRLTRALGPATMGPTTDSAPLNHSFLATAGGSTTLFGLPAGVYMSLPYSRTFSFYDNGKVQRHSYNGSSGTLDVNKDYTEVKGTTEVNWAGTAGVSLQLAKGHDVGYTFLFNQYAEDSARIRAGTDYYNGGSVDLNRLQFIERNLTTHQFKGAHTLEGLNNVRLDWLLTASETTQDEPDTRFYNTFNGQFGTGSDEPLYPARFFRDLTEKALDGKADVTIPFQQWNDDEGEFKLGFMQNNADRAFNERIFYYDTTLQPTDPEDFLTPDSLGHSTPVTNGNLVTYSWPVNLRQRYDKSFYTGQRTINAGYAMVDTPVLSWLRFIGGARVESTDISVTSYSTVASLSSPSGQTNTTQLQETDVLPAAALVFSLRTNMTLRASYGETIARPSFRELAGIRSYDPVLDVLLEGNPNLTMTHVKNYDLRWEWFPGPGDVLSVGVFHKVLDAPIIPKFVQASGDVLTYANGSEAIVQGVEFEARKSLGFLGADLRNFTVGGNLSLIKSEMDLLPGELAYKQQFDPNISPTVPLVDQSPYIFNFDLTYDNPRTATTVTAAYNIFGPRLLATSLNSPDIYEQPVASLDLVVSQRLSKHWKVKFTAKNLLNPEVKKTYGEDEQAIYSSHTRGITFGLSLAAEF